MPTAAAGDCQEVICKATHPGYFCGFHTSLVEVDRRDCVIQEKHINDSLVIRYFLLFAHTFISDRTPVLTRLPGARLLLCQTIWHAEKIAGSVSREKLKT